MKAVETECQGKRCETSLVERGTIISTGRWRRKGKGAVYTPDFHRLDITQGYCFCLQPQETVL